MTETENHFGRTVLYGRVSTRKQLDGKGLQEQMEGGHAYCEKQGWSVDEDLIDDGKSAFHGHNRSRGVLGKFEQDALAGLEQGTRLVCYNLDRLSRGEPEDSYDFVRSLLRNGVTIVTTCDGERYFANDKDMMKVFKQFLIYQRSHEESATKGKRTRDNWTRKLKEAATTGKPLRKVTFPWLRIVNDSYQLNTDALPLLLRIFMLSDAGHGALTIVRMLNTEKVPVWGKGMCWHHSKITRVLTNRACIGEHVTRSGEVIQLYPAAVPMDLFERVNANAKDRFKQKGGRKSKTVANLFSGLCRCSVCNRAMVMSGSEYLRCMRNHEGACTNRVSVHYGRFEATVLDQCLHLALDDNTFSNRTEVLRLNQTIAERTRTLNAAQDKARSLMDLYVTQQSQLAQTMALEAEQAATALVANLEALKEQREQAKGRASNMEHMKRVADMRKHLGTDVALRKRVAQGFQSLIREVRFAPDGRVSVEFVASAALLNFDQDLKLVSSYDLVKDGRETVPQLVAYAKRRAAAKEAGTLFTEQQTSKTA